MTFPDYLLTPGKTYDNFICSNCFDSIQKNIKFELIKNNKEDNFPTVIAEFSQKDERLIESFIERNNISEKFKQTIYNSYVDVSLTCLLLQTTKKQI